MNVSIIVVARQPEQLVDDSIDQEEAIRQVMIGELFDVIDTHKDSANTFIHEGLDNHEKEDIRYSREVKQAADTLLQYYTTRDEYNSLMND